MITQFFRVLLFTIRKLLPHLLRLAWYVARLIWQTVVVWAAGVKMAVERMGHEYLQFAALKGIPGNLEPVIYYGTIVIAVVELTVGWVLASFATVWLIRVVF